MSESGTAEGEAAEDEELPAVPDESGPDLDSINEAIEEEETEEEEDDQEDVDEETETTSADDPMSSFEGIESFGDAYVTGLVTVSNHAVEAVEGENANPVSEDLARDLELDKAMDEWMGEFSDADQMSPMQQLLTMTVVFVAIVLASNPALVERILDMIAGEDGGGDGA